MPSSTSGSQIANFLNPDRCLWFAIGILASCVAYTAQCQFQTLKARRTRAAARKAPRDETVYVASGNTFVALKSTMYSPEARRILSRRLGTAVSVEVLTVFARSSDPVIRDLVAVIVRQRVASRSYMFYLARCIESRRGHDRVTSLLELRFIITPRVPPLDPSCDFARFDPHWSPLILDTLRDKYVLEAVIKSLVGVLLSIFYEGHDYPSTARQTLFLLSVLMQYYKHATELAVYHGLVEWMRLLRRRCAVQEGLMLWLGPCRREFAPRGELAVCMRHRAGFSALMVGDGPFRGATSLDAGLTRCVVMVMRMQGGMELLVKAALWGGGVLPRDLSELDSENEDGEDGEDGEEGEEGEDGEEGEEYVEYEWDEEDELEDDEDEE
ncbi:hypothetical protein P167DRAFT_549423 [Morchella conica CCBAS932]|uniref:Uncharacterized protein n=1 Tax=Morchella conica CCBAS932 TaxID=1392247 RepID=A0A3N4KPX0_9PEZI|nr:hypothetical protein P167DRAFT_549423 [Morchella conica CCBAS932]